MKNLIQDVIDSGFEISDHQVNRFHTGEFLHYQVSIYPDHHFGIFYKSDKGGVSRIEFSSSINPWEYGKDYRILNVEEIETFERLMGAIEL